MYIKVGKLYFYCHNSTVFIFSRLELFDRFFSSLPDLLLQLPKESSDVAMLVIRIMNRCGQQNCQPLITTLRKNLNKLFGKFLVQNG